MDKMVFSSFFLSFVGKSIVTVIRKTVWKHRPNWPFLCWETNYTIQLIVLYHISKCRQTKEMNQLILFTFLSDYQVFFFSLSRFKHTRVKLCHNRLQFVKETQIMTISNAVENQTRFLFYCFARSYQTTN